MNSTRKCGRLPPLLEKEMLFLEIHSYVLGTLFNLLGVTAVFFLYRLVKMRGQPFIICINALLIVMAILRYLYLAIDPYNMKMLFHFLVVQVLEDLAIPCLTSAFAMVQCALFQLCKVRRLSPVLQKPCVLATIVAVHFSFVLVSDGLIIIDAVGCWPLILCQVVTQLWGLFLCVSVMVVTLKLVVTDKRVKRTLRGSMRSTNRNANVAHDVTEETQPARSNANPPANVELQRTNPDDVVIEMAGDRRNTDVNANKVNTLPSQRRKKDHLRKIKIICVSASLTGLLCFAVSLLGVMYVVNPVRDYHIGPIPWLCYQTVQRLVELIFGFILLYISYQRPGSSPATRT
ncbi:uncharacterized protein [Diadema antillarum]|uniref:uncharacterized protein n=1 Tax=Diadema antillarum TaxID=105358 RepID=UPI003A8A44BB